MAIHHHHRVSENTNTTTSLSTQWFKDTNENETNEPGVINNEREFYTMTELSEMGLKSFSIDQRHKTIAEAYYKYQRDRTLLLIRYFSLLPELDVLNIGLADLAYWPCSNGGNVLLINNCNHSTAVNSSGVLRNEDWRICPIGAIAFMLLVRYEHYEHTLPTFDTRSSWEHDLLCPHKMKQPTVANTQQVYAMRNVLICSLASVSVRKSRAGSVIENSAAKYLESRDYKPTVTNHNGLWDEGDDYIYTSPISLKGMIKLASSSLDYNIERDVEIDGELENMIFTGVDVNWPANIETLNDNDTNCLNFLRYMMAMRRIIIQDAPYWRDAYPELPLWNLPVFQTEKFEKFASNVLKVDFDLVDTDLARAPPPPATIVNDYVVNQVFLKNRIDQLEQTVNDLSTKLKVTQEEFSKYINKTETIIIEPSSSSSSVVKLTSSDQQRLISDEFGMDRSIDNIQLAWIEWFHGLPGKPSVVTMNKIMGDKWRITNDERIEFYNKRQVVINELQWCVRQGVPENIMLSLVQSRLNNVPGANLEALYLAIKQINENGEHMTQSIVNEFLDSMTNMFIV